MIKLDRDQLAEYIRRLRQRIIAMTGRPINLVLSRFEQTGSTDCVRQVCINPRPLEEGKFEVALGISTHEAGHVCNSPWGGELMQAAHKKGGEALAAIVNLLLDRKDDFLVRQDFPGARADLAARASWVMPHVSKDERTENPYTDFFYACKAFARPCSPVVWTCIKLIRKHIPSFRMATPQQFLDCAEAILKLIGESVQGAMDSKQRQAFLVFVKNWEKLESAMSSLTPDEVELILQIITDVERDENSGMFPDFTDEEAEHPAGEVGKLELPPDDELVPEEHERFGYQLDKVAHLVHPLRRALEDLSEPEIEHIRGLDDGEVDTQRLANLILGEPNVYREERIIRQGSKTIAFALDTSSSMDAKVVKASEAPTKIDYGRQLGVLFNAALHELPDTVGHCWTYDSCIRDCGPARIGSGIAAASTRGSNCDSFMAARLVQYFRRNPADTMMAFFVSDGGPDSIKDLRTQINLLRQMNVRTLQFFIESDGQRRSSIVAELAQIFDYQLIFDSDSIDEMLFQFAELLHRVFLLGNR